MRGAKLTVERQNREVRKETTVEMIKVSNRFGGLCEEGETKKPVEDGGEDGENKENENTMNLSSIGSSRVFGKEMAFVAKGDNGNQKSTKVGHKEKKAGNSRGSNPLKFKLQNVGPTRGLVFSPTRSETELMMSGKRLRVESESVGRPGGVFAGLEEFGRKEQGTEYGDM